MLQGILKGLSLTACALALVGCGLVGADNDQVEVFETASGRSERHAAEGMEPDSDQDLVSEAVVMEANQAEMEALPPPESAVMEAMPPAELVQMEAIENSIVQMEEMKPGKANQPESSKQASFNTELSIDQNVQQVGEKTPVEVKGLYAEAESAYQEEQDDRVSEVSKITIICKDCF